MVYTKFVHNLVDCCFSLISFSLKYPKNTFLPQENNENPLFYVENQMAHRFEVTNATIDNDFILML